MIKHQSRTSVNINKNGGIAEINLIQLTTIILGALREGKEN